MTAERVPLLYRVHSEVVSRLIPSSVVFEVTRRCNMDCRMCYVVDHAQPHPEELDTREAQGVLDQLAQAGTLQVIFSGGEPFMRPDLFDILAHARLRAFCIDIFTNGTSVGLSEARELKRLAVWQVSVSLLGATAEVHDAITQRRGSFHRALEGIEALVRTGVKARIKTVLLRENFHEYPGIVSLAQEWGIPYSFDPVVSSRNDGSREPLALSLTDEQFMAILSDESLAPGTLSYDDERLDEARGRRLGGYMCKAAVTFCDISWNGDVLPCMQYPQPAGNLRTQRFGDIWRSSPLFIQLREARYQSAPECKDCSLLPLCFRCPATAALEKGDPLAAYETACRHARLMDQVRRRRMARMVEAAP